MSEERQQSHEHANLDLVTRGLDPNTRDQILHILETRIQEPIYRLLTPREIRQLGELESPDDPIISFYMTLDPEHRHKNAWHTLFKDLVRETLERIEDKRKRAHVAHELHRIELAMLNGLPSMGRGVAFFVCEKLGLWRQVALSIPLPSRIYIDAKPFIRPLARTRDEHDRYSLSLLSFEHNRYFVSQIGIVEEVYDFEGIKLRGLFTDFVDPVEHDHVRDDIIQKFGKAQAQVAALIHQQFEARYLLVSGSPKMRAAFKAHLPKALQPFVAAEFELDIHASLPEIAQAIEPAQREVEAREEVATLRRIEESYPYKGVWGVEDTIKMLNEQRVMTLVVNDDYRRPGGYCTQCHTLHLETEGTCSYCGGTIEDVEDLIDLALERALEQDATLELVRSPQAKERLSAHAPMGALLRF